MQAGARTMMQKNLGRIGFILLLLQYIAAMIPFLLTLRTLLEKHEDYLFHKRERLGAELLRETFAFEHAEKPLLESWTDLLDQFKKSFKTNMHGDIPQSRLPNPTELVLFKKTIGRDSKLILDPQAERYFLISSLIDVHSKLRLEIANKDIKHFEELIYDLGFSLETSQHLSLMEPIQEALKNQKSEAVLLDAIKKTESETLDLLIEKIDLQLQKIRFNMLILVFFGLILAPSLLILMFTRFIKPLTQEFILLRKRLNTLFKGARNGIFEWDIQKNQLYFDTSLYQTLQLDASKHAIQCMEDWYKAIHEEDLEHFKAVLQSGKNPFTAHYKIHSSAGTQWVETIGFLSMNAKGQAETAVGLHKNVTEEHLMREALTEATHLRESQAKLATLGELSSGMAHEINNPLTVLMSRLRRLRQKLEKGESISKEEQVESLKKAEGQSERIASIIRTFKNFSRNGTEDPLESVPLRSLLQDVEELCSDRAQKAKVELRGLHLNEQLLVACRASEIVQVLVNLVGNAVEAIEETEQTGWVQVDVKTSPEDSMCAIRVFDSGPGVPPAIEKKIMEAFFTTKPKGKGTGLGLSISAKIARDHGGSLSLNRSVSNSCFELKLQMRTKA
jgi:signal transduction histidine kinase